VKVSNYKSCYLLRNNLFRRPDVVTKVLHGSALLFRKILVNYFNVSHDRCLPHHFLFMHRQKINALKILAVKCKENRPFDIRKFNTKPIYQILDWIYGAYGRVL
jgi:hypothetical protein